MKRLMLGAGAVLICLGAWAAILQQPISKTTGEVQSYAFVSPPGHSAEDSVAFSAAVATGGMLPPGWQITSQEGQVKLIDTGLRLVPSNEQLWTVILIDDTADIQSAVVKLNGSVVGTATRANGKIVDRSGKGIATIGLVVPPEGQGWQGTVEWTGDDGSVRVFDGPLGS